MEFGRASGGTRTPNLRITNAPLCRLSYAGWIEILMEIGTDILEVGSIHALKYSGFKI